MKKIPLEELNENDKNPRSITVERFGRLVDSVLVFPQMLELRPIVTDDSHVCLGGNMRCRALKKISDMPFGEIEERLASSRDFAKKTEEEGDRGRTE